MSDPLAETAEALPLAELAGRLAGRPVSEVSAAAGADQAARWHAGERVTAEAYLAALPGLAAAAEEALVLIVGEVLLRRGRGEKPGLAEYQARFPHLADLLAVQFEVEDALAGGESGGPNGTWSAAQPQTEAETRPGGPAGRVTAAGRDPQSAELQTLLRKRLLAIAVVCWAAFAVYGVALLPRFLDVFGVALYALWLVVTGLVVLLRSRRPLSLPQLRGVEFLLFGSQALTLTLAQCRLLTWGWLTRLAEDWQGMFLLARSLSFGWFAVIAVYGVLVPNTGRRCAAVVGVLAVWSVLLNATAGLWAGPIGSRQHSLFVLETAINMGLAASLAVYGSHRIETLRSQAEKARRLGPYRLVRKLGAGGMGEVYLAEHRLLKRPCAVKLIRPEHAADETAARRFEREVQAATRLGHPATVQVYDYGRADDGTFYYVMEYLPGFTLDQVVERAGPLPPGRVVYVLRQVCGALAEAHGLGLVHRDVKPGNVMLCRLGGRADAAKLLDFGLVSVAGDVRLTQTGGIMGTPAYMSPEQARGAEAGPTADVYAVGAVGYFLLTGRTPFEGKNPLEVLHAHLSAAVAPPSGVNPGVPADLEGVVLRCLAKDPAGRFTSAAELDAALAGCGHAADWTEANAAASWDAAPAAHPDPA